METKLVKIFTLCGADVYIKAHTDDEELNKRLEDLAHTKLADALYKSDGFHLWKQTNS